MILYLVFFSMTSVMLLACGGDEKVESDKVGSATDAVAPTEIDPALSAKLATGEKLAKAHCSSCHQAEMYTRAESKIKSAEALLTQIKACDANIGSGLFDEDMTAIAAYLEVNFYKFAK